MKAILNKPAAVLSLIIGLMAVVAGGKVLLGNDPGYYVIDWVPVYNFSMGLFAVLVTTALLWVNHKAAITAVIATLSAHSLVMVVLQTAYRDVVAPDSIRAMTIRIVVTLVILGLMLLKRSNRAAVPLSSPPVT